MTLTQWRRMKVFALRMVRASTTPRWQPRLRSLVAECLDRFAGNESWPIFLNWDKSERHPDDDGTEGFSWQHPRELLCDEVKRFIWDCQDNGELPAYHPSKESRMGILLTCCIRAAADIAVAPSAGVSGWTVGDLKEMWKPRPVPKWVTMAFDGDILSAPDDTAIWM